jgi:predicted nuclease of restriction endonuclease-like (RecB) superfamily
MFIRKKTWKRRSCVRDEAFIMELGVGFTFVPDRNGSQWTMMILPDLLFYHRDLRRLVPLS